MSVSLVAILILGMAVSPVLAAVTDYFAGIVAQEGMLSEMAIHPAAIRDGEITYVAYQGPGYDPFISAYSEDTGWTRPINVGKNPLSLDAHGAPSMFFDSTGRLHVLYGSHFSPMYHVMTEEPGDIYSWVEQPLFESVGTYPQAVETTSGGTAVFYRAASHHWNVRYAEETTEGLTFTDPLRVLEATTSAAYYADFRRGESGKIHAAWTRLDRDLARTGELQARFDAYYMFMDTDGIWRNAASEEITLPLTAQVAADKCRVYTSKKGSTNEITVKEDADGNPCLLFLTGSGDGEGAFTWRFERHDGADWNGTEITTADHYFDSGALDPQPDGSFEAFLVGDESDIEEGIQGRGGGIGRWESDDNGATWTLAEPRISPEDPRALFADPQLVRDGTADERVVFIEWTDDPTNFFQRAFMWGDGGYVQRDTISNPVRLAGANRIGTAVEVSKHSYPERSRVVVLATAYDFPDALAGTPLAHAMRAPLLLTGKTSLDPAVAEEIQRLGATKAVLLGGEGALAKEIETQLVNEAGITSIERLGGADRYTTALEIARRLRSLSTMETSEAIVVSGRDWPDAVSAAPVAAILGAPIVLSGSSKLAPSMETLLQEWETTATVVVGGPAAVSETITAGLPNPERIGGADRYQTSSMVAEYGLERGLMPHRILFATGVAFPDALCASALAGRVRGPVLLTKQAVLPGSTRGFLAEHGKATSDAYFIGGEGVIGLGVQNAVKPYTD